MVITTIHNGNYNYTGLLPVSTRNSESEVQSTLEDLQSAIHAPVNIEDILSAAEQQLQVTTDSKDQIIDMKSSYVN